jgi:hypothetical protein
MTNDQLLFIYKQNLDVSIIAALKGVYAAGYHEGAGLTPTANGIDFAAIKTAPACVIKVRRPD